MDPHKLARRVSQEGNKMTMAVVLVAVAATIGNMIQGWDNATIAGAILYIKREFQLEKEATTEGLILAMSLIGATFMSILCGPLADSYGRRPMLILSSILYFICGLIMLWAPNVYVLILARLLDGFAIGLALNLVPIYISETAPTEIRGFLNTFPQLCGSTGTFLAYCMVFGMSLKDSPSWRFMLGLLSILSLVYFALTLFFLPESPRWLASKGRIIEAKRILQRLRGNQDVLGELALLVEGLGVGYQTSVEEYIIGPANALSDDHETIKEDEIRLYGPEGEVSWVAKPVKDQSLLAAVSSQGSPPSPGLSLVDPLVTLFGSIHDKPLSETGSLTLFSNMGSMLSTEPQNGKQEDYRIFESLKDDDQDLTVSVVTDSDNEELHKPFLSREATGTGTPSQLPADTMFRCHSSMMQGNDDEPSSSMTDIGGGWQLAWKWSNKIGGPQRIYLHQEGSPASRRGSIVSNHAADQISEEGDKFIHATALVSQPQVHPLQLVAKRPSWRDLSEPGVKRALFVGVGMYILQQFAGINGVQFYTPQILEKAGVTVLVSNLGLRIGSDSISLLISALTSLVMLPCIMISMRLMDVTGRRGIMLATIPILVVALVALIVSSAIRMGSAINATISTASVVVYLSCFVMGFGAIPNIICSEIFPTNVRGLCITICALTFWVADIIVTYTIPVMLKAIGLGGVFGIFAVVCSISWIFVFTKVPETKGMPLEVISEFFAAGPKTETKLMN